MHMSDALLSPGVGASFCVISGGAVAYCARKLGDREETASVKVPLMGVLGAFVFAGQMINFSIPGTGSSGHIGGGMLLTMLLGPYAAFITMSCILIIQALLFADGGVLALGANIFNMGAWPCFLGWLIYRAIAGRNPTPGRLRAASLLGVVLCLELGALGVTVQTVLSGRSELPLGPFAAMMLGIHLPIGLMEGLATAAVVAYVHRLRPSIIESLFEPASGRAEASTLKPVLLSLGAAAVLTAGVLSWFASGRPDGLEYSVAKISGHEELPLRGRVTRRLAQLQEKTALLPDYGFRAEAEGETAGGDEAWPSPSAGTTFAGLVGAFATLIMAALAGGLFFSLRPGEAAK